MISFGNSSSEKIKEWFEKGDWRQAWKVSPDPTIDVENFSSFYSGRPALWDKAFKFLASTDLEGIGTGDFSLDGDDLLVKVQQYTTKEEEDTLYEAHRKYADIQYVISGSERIGVVPLENTEEAIPYDDLNDVVFLSSGKDRYHLASQDNFFIFLPEDAHRPCVKDELPALVKKIVIKVRVD